MPLPDLEGALTDRVFSTCDRMLGDTMTIVPPSGPPVTLKGHGEFRDKRKDFGMSAATVQDMQFDIDKAAVSGKPDATWLVTFPKIPGKSYHPIDVRTDDSGHRWEFNVKTVVA